MDRRGHAVDGPAHEAKLSGKPSQREHERSAKQGEHEEARDEVDRQGLPSPQEAGDDQAADIDSPDQRPQRGSSREAKRSWGFTRRPAAPIRA